MIRGTTGSGKMIEIPQAVLRPWHQDDAESLVRHANNRRIWKNLRDGFPYPYTADDADRWLVAGTRSDPVQHFAIAIQAEAVGGIGLIVKDDVYRRSAEVGYWLGEEFWGRGVMTEALRAMTLYAFNTFDICRLYAGVFEYNPASARVLEKCGFTLEGRLRRAICKDGRMIDELLYALVREV